MNMKKTALSTAIVVAMGSASYSANAVLITGSVLSIDAGSNFTMAPTPVGPVTTSITSGTQGGLIIGTTQNVAPSHPTHGGAPHTNKGKLDREWSFFGNTGVSFTQTAVTQLTSSGTSKTLDFSGWRVSWNGIPSINMGGGLQDCGTSTDGICATSGGDIAGTFDNGTGIASITCSTSSCSNSSTYTLTYSAVVPQADPSGFGGANYGLTLTGTVSAVPVPAAVWLFGSGLLGLVGVARRKKV